jgi:hypothetical protein
MQTKSESTTKQSTPANPETPPVSIQPGLLGTFDLVTQQHRELREQFEQVRAERDTLLERQRQMAELMKSPNPDKIVHDLRNLLNELQLYKLLVETQQKSR